MGRPGEDLTGQRFGRLTAVKNLGRATGKTIWLFRCDCGKDVEMWAAGVKNGKTSSCGCLRSDLQRERKTTHGIANSPTYATWNMMLQRCNNPKNTNYHRYGGRGIKVCERWLKFENFLEDMGERPEGMTIDRKDGNGNYEPGNCRWATNEVQQNNKRNSRYMVYDNRKQTVGQWAKEIGIGYETLLKRTMSGWPDDLAITTPISVPKSFKSKT